MPFLMHHCKIYRRLESVNRSAINFEQSLAVKLVNILFFLKAVIRISSYSMELASFICQYLGNYDKSYTSSFLSYPVRIAILD